MRSCVRSAQTNARSSSMADRNHFAPPCGSEGGSNAARRCNPLRAAAPSSQLHFSSYASLANTFRQLGPPSWVPHAAIFRALRSRSNREARAPLQGIYAVAAVVQNYYRPAAPASHYHGFDTAARKPVARPAPAAEQAAASSSLWRHLCKHQRRACLPRRAGQHDVLSTDLCRCAR